MRRVTVSTLQWGERKQRLLAPAKLQACIHLTPYPHLYGLARPTWHWRIQMDRLNYQWTRFPEDLWAAVSPDNPENYTCAQARPIPVRLSVNGILTENQLSVCSADSSWWRGSGSGPTCRRPRTRGRCREICADGFSGVKHSCTG